MQRDVHREGHNIGAMERIFRLNKVSTFDEEVIENQMQYPVRGQMCESPTEDEIIEAMDHIKKNKAEGSNGILPEMVNACGANILDYIQDLFGTVWSEGVPQEWENALLIPISKKGDLS